MANTTAITYPVNGSSKFVAKFDITGDGSGEASAVEVLDPANLTGTPSDFRISKLTWQLQGFTATLLWDATTDKQVFAMNAYEGEIDFLKCAGAPLINNAGTGKNGKLLITTVGLGAGDTGTIFITGYHTQSN